MDVAAVVFFSTTVNHLGLISAIESAIKHRLWILDCPKCLSFWSVLVYGLSGDGMAANPSCLARLLAISILSVLLTDSNCRPSSIHWIRSMVSKYSESHTNVAGISNYEKKGTFANKFMRYEMALYNINLFSYLKAAGNYHVDTKNFMFNKKDFLSQKDLPSFFTVSNDGSAILSRLVNKAQTGTMINDYAQMQDNRQYSFGAWFATVSSRYSNYKFIKPLPKFVKGLFVTTTLLSVLMAIWFMYYTCFNLLICIFCLLLSLVRIAVWFFTTKKSLVDIGQKDLNLDIVLYDFILVFLRPVLYVSASIRHNNKLWS